MKTNTVLLLFAASLNCSVMLSTQAVNPPPDGGYMNANTAEGQTALFSLTNGVHNTALGFQALLRNTTGNVNTASGSQALLNNTTGNRNTATGFSALSSNTTGSENTAIGLQALFGNTTANGNTAIGFQAIHGSSSGGRNTAIGYQALFTNDSGSFNTAIGEGALFGNLSGNSNTAVGDGALNSNFLGHNNIALGFAAGAAIHDSSFNIDIGNIGDFDESNTIRIGDNNQSKCFVAGIRGVTTQNGDAIPVQIDSAGQLGTASSSRRFKKEVRPMDKLSEAVLGLKPVTFHYKADAKDIPQFGLIAEDVAAVNPDLVVRDKNGDIYTVRYDAVNAMLLNEFLKEHNAFVEEQAKVREQGATIARLEQQVETLTAGLQKVSAQLEMIKLTPQVVANDQ